VSCYGSLSMNLGAGFVLYLEAHAATTLPGRTVRAIRGPFALADAVRGSSPTSRSNGASYDFDDFTRGGELVKDRVGARFVGPC
jgi:hypothetical protein